MSISKQGHMDVYDFLIRRISDSCYQSDATPEQSQAILIIIKLLRERQNQILQKGEQNHEPVFWISIIAEGVGQMAKMANDHKLNELSGNSSTSGDMNTFSELVTGLIQCMATTMAALDSIYRNEVTDLQFMVQSEYKNQSICQKK